jgi:hypothetical protein
MLDDLDATILALLNQELPPAIPSSSVTINFATPDSTFVATDNKPALNIFLYDIRENMEMRASDVMARQQTSSSQTTLSRPSMSINVSYIITAWSSTSPPVVNEEHHLLSAVFIALLRYPTIPAELLQGSLAGLLPLPRTLVLQPSYLSNLGEFWSAMGGRPKVMVHYTVTLPVYAFNPITEVPLINKVITRTDNPFDNSSNNQITQAIITGEVQTSDTKLPLPGATVTLTNSINVSETTVATNGYFYFVNVPDGSYAISASPPDPTLYQASTPTTVTVKSSPVLGGNAAQSITITLNKATNGQS